MAVRDYLRWEGTNSAVLGLALVLAAAVFGDWGTPWLAAVVAVMGGAVAWWAGRRTVARAVAAAGAGEPPVDVRREVVVETAVWIAAVTAWVAVTGNDPELIAGTGVASVAFGLARATAPAPAELRVARRGAFRTPRLTTP